jgi:uncharacterized membrane protein YidH (DUF202 family)
VNLSGDHGAQVERTALSWQRTAAAILACALAISRITTPHLSLAAAGVTAAAVGPAMALMVLSHNRYRRMTFTLGTPQARGRALPGKGPDARLPIAVCVVMIGMCLVELIHLLLTRTT